MRSVFWLLACVLLVASGRVSIAEDITVENLNAKLNSLISARDEEGCAAWLERSEELNAPEAFYAAGVCGMKLQFVDFTFLFLVGQQRAMADMSHLNPRTEADMRSAGALYRMIFFQFGGHGADGVYRDEAKREELFEKFEEWSPTFSPEYDPGWDYDLEDGGEAAYLAMVQDKARQWSRIRLHADLLNDPDYYPLHTEFEALQRENPGGFVDGRPAFQRFLELQEAMTAIRARYTD